jgi:hypothetical protein
MFCWNGSCRRECKCYPQTIATEGRAIGRGWHGLLSSGDICVVQTSSGRRLYVAAVSLAGGLVAEGDSRVNGAHPIASPLMGLSLAARLRKSHSCCRKRFVAHRVSCGRLRHSSSVPTPRSSSRHSAAGRGGTAEVEQKSITSCRVQRGGSRAHDGDGRMVYQWLGGEPGCGPRRHSSNRSSARRPWCS